MCQYYFNLSIKLKTLTCDSGAHIPLLYCSLLIFPISVLLSDAVWFKLYKYLVIVVVVYIVWLTIDPVTKHNLTPTCVFFIMEEWRFSPYNQDILWLCWSLLYKWLVMFDFLGYTVKAQAGTLMQAPILGNSRSCTWIIPKSVTEVDLTPSAPFLLQTAAASS